MKRILAASLVASLSFATLLPAVPSYADATRDRQWFATALRFAEVHQITQGNGVIVAVIDSGVEQDHPDLIGNVLPGTDIVAGGAGNGWGDKSGHGTGMAGLIAAHGHGSGGKDGALGVAPKARILPIRVFINDNEPIPGNFYAKAIDWAVAHGAKIISISANTAGGDFEAVKRAHAAGVIVVGSAGNAPDDSFVAAPASYDGFALAVGGTDRNGNHWTKSVTGKALDIAAPAVDITSTSSSNSYRTGTGTSDSAAIIAGALALIWSRYPTLSRDEVIYRLLATAVDKGTRGKDEQTGNGLVDIVAALTADAVLPSPSITSRETGSLSVTAPTSTAEAPTQPDGVGASIILMAIACLLVIAVMAIVAVARRRRNRKS
ncbi:type VII secretion-associated serine protease mycosin [Allocatelliglobosispora scoriae]|uniref:Type VII secretion-associated serine protease mycosin n=1 Tax=Allocatelliglobosispora scoriae TaxID=643052 RepID=A0A841BWV4_9ACTN|nr:S8 family serine peptidase [Allocatelliglobosispora scoriae]MBB5871629.1 type VII secretion-associated serine protease mycosin [Allocatelliglobosispora scoriae]